MPFDGPDGYAVFCEAAARTLRPRRPLSIAEWAAARRFLSAKSSSEAGAWKNERIPFLRGVMDALDRSHPAWLVVFMKSSQVGATEAALNWVGQTIDEDPAPMLALFPGEKLGKRWVRKRLNPMIASTPSLRLKIPLGRRSDKGDTLMEKDFPDGGLTIGSANIPSDMASIAVAKLLCDEVDRFPLEVGDEGDPVEIAIRRLSSYSSRKKAFINSSPTIEALSHINPWWLQSSQGHYYVPCPHCNEMQVLTWENLKYPDGKPREAQYMCTECAALIPEHHKTEMLAAGEWRHTFDDRADEVIGFHISCLYTPIGLGDTWAENAVVWERSKRDPAKAKVFTNTRLGETHKDPNEKLDWESLFERREAFPLRTIPVGCLILTAGVDVQKDRLEVQMIGWGRNECAWTIDYRIFTGDPTRDEVWDELDNYLAGELLNAFGVKMRVVAAAIDSGYLQNEVLSFTRIRKGRVIFATKGTGQMGRTVIGRPTHVDVKLRGKLDKRGAEQYAIGEATAKAALHDRMRADAEVSPDQRHVHFSDELPEEYFRQLAAEVFDPHKRKFIKVYERNESLDSFVYAMVAAMHHSVAIHRIDELAWQRLEQMYQRAGVKPVPTGLPTRIGGAFLPTAALIRRPQS